MDIGGHMPVYEYRCPSCERIHEVVTQGFKHPRTVRCDCGARAKKIITAPCDFLLKGPGWPGKELSMGEVVSNEKKRATDFQRDRRNLRRDGVEFPYWGDE